MGHVDQKVAEAIATVEQVLSTLRNLQSSLAALEPTDETTLKTPHGRLTDYGRREMDSMIMSGVKGTEIARYLSISSPAVTNRRRRLEKKGLLRRGR